MEELWSGEVKILGATSWEIQCDHEGEIDMVPKIAIADESEIFDERHVDQIGTLVIPLSLAKEIGWA